MINKFDKELYLSNIIDLEEFENNSHMIFEEEFYIKHVENNLNKIKKHIDFRVISVKIVGELEFFHSTHKEYIESIFKNGLTFKQNQNGPKDIMGDGIYVHEYKAYKLKNKLVKGTELYPNLKGKCIVEFIKCMFSDEIQAIDGRLNEGDRVYVIRQTVSPEYIEIIE